MDVRPYRGGGVRGDDALVERSIDATSSVPAPFSQCRAVLVRAYARIVPSAAYPGMDIEVGEVEDTGTTVRVPVSWRAATFERFAPIFEGALELSPEGGGSRLDLRGHYVVPLGAAGRFGDGLIGRRIARRTAAGVIEAIAESILDAVRGDTCEPDRQGAPVPGPSTTVRDRGSA